MTLSPEFGTMADADDMAPVLPSNTPWDGQAASYSQSRAIVPDVFVTLVMDMDKEVVMKG